MMLVEQTTLPSGSLPIADFKDHLRLGTGFADDDAQDVVLEAALRAAIAAIEAHTSKVTVSRDYEWTVSAWRDLATQALPIAPVATLAALTIVDRMGDAEVIDPARYRLVPDPHRPRVTATGFYLPQIPVGGKAVIAFQAGYGPAWSAVPADLAHAIFMLAALYYDERTPRGEATSGLPGPIATLVQPYRELRLFGGSRV